MAAYQGARHLNMKEVFPDDWGSYCRYEIAGATARRHQQPMKLDINIPGFPMTMKHWAYHRVPLP